MPAVRLAILDEQLTSQLAERDEPVEGVDVVWMGTDAERFRREVPEAAPDAIVIDLGVLGPEPVDEARGLVEATGADLALVLYTFARRDLLAALGDAHARPLRSPLSVESLRGILSGLMVRKILARQDSPVSRVDPVWAERRGVPAPRAVPFVEPARYTPGQLGRLKEIQSAIACECPANVADLLTQLVAFERYSANCANRNEADRQIHQMLYERTAQARAIMESALARLLEHEKIAI